MPSRPPFSALPLNSSDPAGNAWGPYGADDQLGPLNLLTPLVVANAAKIRAPHRITHTKPTKRRNDTTATTLKRVSKTSNVISLDVVVENGGIVGRGVLLDYAKYCEMRSIKIDAMTSHGIPFTHLQELAEGKNIEFRSGDILFMQNGFTVAYNALTNEQQEALAARKSSDFSSVEATKYMVNWIWESEFAAVASDCPAFKQGPPSGAHTQIGGMWKGEPWEDELQGRGLLHQFLLAGCGCPIGEL